MESSTNIADFYAGKTVFITGGTGFLGKVLIEKLVYSCPKLKKIYVLIRETEEQSVSQRFQHFLNCLVFTRLKNEKPDDLNKIVPVVGDLCEPNLGLKPSDEDNLVNEVSVVIHSGATIKFNEELETAMKINYEGTKKVLKLCRRMKNMKVLVHISTAYAHTDVPVLEEVIYPPPADVAGVYKTIEVNRNNEKEIKKILNGHPNTYTFTKALTEYLIADTHGNIPVVIIRPSIVTPGHSEPLSGWVDNWNGATGLLTLVSKGLCRAIPTKDEHILDMIPVDFVSNLTLAAAAKCDRSDSVMIYNSCTGSCNPITMRRITCLYNDVAIKHKFNAIPYPNIMVFTPHLWIVYMITFILKTIAGIFDFFMLIFGRRTRYYKLYTKLDMILSIVEYFTLRTWEFRCDRVDELNATLSEADETTFQFHPKRIQWENYAEIYFDGVKKYLIEKKKLTDTEDIKVYNK